MLEDDFRVSESESEDALDPHARGALTRAMLDAHRARAVDRADESDALDGSDAATTDATDAADSFEVSDGACSSHSEGSHDRTRGVKSFSRAEVATEAFGRGKRRRGCACGRLACACAVARAVAAADVLGEVSSASEREGSDDDERDRDGGFARARARVGGVDGDEAAADASTSASPRRADVIVLDAAVEMPHRASPGRRTRPFGEINANTMGSGASSRQPTIMSMFSKAAAPWKFDHRIFGPRRGHDITDDSVTMNCDVHVERDIEERADVEDVKREGVRVLEDTMRDFISRRSVGRVGVSLQTTGTTQAADKMTVDEIGNWRFSMAIFERADGFWTGFHECLRTFVEEERAAVRSKLNLAHGAALDDASLAVSLEAVWELVFTAAKVWLSEGYQTEHFGGRNWATQAWAVIGWLVDESPLMSSPVATHRIDPSTMAFNAEEYNRAIIDRVEELILGWPRCVADRHPVRAIWQRVHGANVNSDATQEWRLTTRNPVACCRACAPIALRPFDETFEAVNMPFLRGAACEPLYRALGFHLAKCSFERKVLHRELGRWLNDARLAKVTDEVGDGTYSTDGFTATGGHSVPLSAASMRLQHRSSVHVELFRVCAKSSLDDQAILCIKQIMNSLASQRQASDEPAPRCILLRAAAACFGIWLEQRVKGGERVEQKFADDVIRMMKSLADCAKATASSEPSVPGTKQALNEGAVIAEASAAWATAYAVVTNMDARRRNEALETLGVLDKMSLSQDWRERVFVSRALTMICSPGSFLDKCAPLTDFRLVLCVWLAVAVDVVSGGAAPLAVALCARAEFLIMNQEASPVTTVGWSQSSGGAAVAAVLRGKARRAEAHVDVAGEHPGALISTQEADFRIAVSKLATRELGSLAWSDESRQPSASFVPLLRCVALALPAHCAQLHKLSASVKSGQDHESSESPHIRVVSGVIRELISNCTGLILVADSRQVARSENVAGMSLTSSQLTPFPPVMASAWGANDCPRFGEVVAIKIEKHAVSIFRAQLSAVNDALRSALRDGDGCLMALAHRQLAVFTCGVLESMTGAPNLADRETEMIKSLAYALRGEDGKPFGVAGETVVRNYLPHFVLSALKAPQKSATRRVIASTLLISRMIEPGSKSEPNCIVSPSYVFGSMALPLVTIVHELMEGATDHHAKAGVEAVLTDLLIPLLGGGFKRDVAVRTLDEPKHPTNTSRIVSHTASSKQSTYFPKPSFPKPSFPKPQPLVSTTRQASNVPQNPTTLMRPIAPVVREVEVTSNGAGTAESVDSMDSTDLARVALSSSAVWRVVRSYVAASMTILTRAALATTVSQEVTSQMSFKVVVKPPEKTPRMTEIERVRETLVKSKKVGEKTLARELNEAERSLSDGLAPLPEATMTIDRFHEVRWGDGPAIAPNAFVVEENASERARSLLVAAIRLLTQCAKCSDPRGRAEVSQYSLVIEDATMFLLDPETRLAPVVASALRALTDVLGIRRAPLPSKRR